MLYVERIFGSDGTLFWQSPLSARQLFWNTIVGRKGISLGVSTQGSLFGVHTMCIDLNQNEQCNTLLDTEIQS